MSASVSKRQQARNERALQDLIRTVPGNEVCADCGTRNPTWASWSLGIFLCMRCAALHRKLGTHISKVKSLSMDSWSTDQLDVMRRVGNQVSSKRYNPLNIKPDIPIDADEVDAAMEKYIRQKYQHQTLATPVSNNSATSKQNTGSTGTGSWTDNSPALPPKPGKRFGFTLRSASSPHPQDGQSHFPTPPMSPTRTGSDRSSELAAPYKPAKSGQLFGIKLSSRSSSLDPKLARLQEMGFLDNAKNSEILKSTNGNLDRTVEVLARLGEGPKLRSRSMTPDLRQPSPPPSSSAPDLDFVVEKQRKPVQKSQSNPWEVRPAVSPPDPLPPPDPIIARSFSAGPSAVSSNPFLGPANLNQSQHPLEHGFQNLQIQPSYALPSTRQNQPSSIPFSAPNSNIWDQSSNSGPASTYSIQPTNHSVPAPEVSANPFLPSGSNPGVSQPTNPWAAQERTFTTASPVSYNPFGVPHEQPRSTFQPNANVSMPVNESNMNFPQPQPSFMSPPQQMPASFQPQNSLPQQPPPISNSQLPQNSFGTNPFQTQMQSPFQAQGVQPSLQTVNPPVQQFNAQNSIRRDNSSILALYNQPHMAPMPTHQTLPPNNSWSPTGQPQTYPAQLSAPGTANTNAFQQNNPFLSQQQAVPQFPAQGVSAPGVAFSQFARSATHNPDAFANPYTGYTR